MATEWFVKVGDKHAGPFTSKQVKEMASSGQITPNSYLCKGQDGEPSGQWVSASKAKGLFESQPSVSTAGVQPKASIPAQGNPERIHSDKITTRESSLPTPINKFFGECNWSLGLAAVGIGLVTALSFFACMSMYEEASRRALPIVGKKYADSLDFETSNQLRRIVRDDGYDPKVYEQYKWYDSNLASRFRYHVQNLKAAASSKYVGGVFIIVLCVFVGGFLIYRAPFPAVLKPIISQVKFGHELVVVFAMVLIGCSSAFGLHLKIMWNTSSWGREYDELLDRYQVMAAKSEISRVTNEINRNPARATPQQMNDLYIICEFISFAPNTATGLEAGDAWMALTDAYDPAVKTIVTREMIRSMKVSEFDFPNRYGKEKIRLSSGIKELSSKDKRSIENTDRSISPTTSSNIGNLDKSQVVRSWNDFVSKTEGRMRNYLQTMKDAKVARIDSEELTESDSVSYPYKGKMQFTLGYNHGYGFHSTTNYRIIFGFKNGEWEYVEGESRVSKSNNKEKITDWKRRGIGGFIGENAKIFPEYNVE